jgi:signal transduction histidine kinase/CheY-like chemotaxis protein
MSSDSERAPVTAFGPAEANTFGVGDFEEYRRRTNVHGMRFGTFQPLLLIPPFLLTDLFLIRGRHFWSVQVLRFLCLAFAVGVRWATTHRREWIERHGDFIWYLLMWTVGVFVSALCWAHTGYDSPYCLGFVFIFSCNVIAITWSLRSVVIFQAVLYLIYLTPLLLGLVSVSNLGMTLLFQMFLLGFMVQSSILHQYRYDARKREFVDSTKLIEANRMLEEKVRQRTAELTEANAKLTETDQYKRQFFASVSHELRTPLTLALGPVEVLLKEVKNPAHRERLQMVRENQMRLLRAIEELLALAQLEAGKVQMEFRRVDLRVVVERLAGAARGAMEYKGITLKSEVPSEQVDAYLDVNKFERVVLNLLNNAFKFTQKRGSVIVRLRREGNEAILSVTDTGVGISKDKQDRIFERFFQVDASDTRQYSGTGIGLSLVQEYTQLHHGTVSVSSELGKGSTFTIRLPLGKDHLAGENVIDEAPVEAVNTERYWFEFDTTKTPVPPSPTAQTPAPPEGSLVDRLSSERVSDPLIEGARILVVDDTPGLRDFLSSLLAPHFEVVTANDGLEGLEKAHEITPDLILSDVMMPRMSGGELCRRLKAEPGELGRIPIILLTAKADDQTKVEILGYGADDYLVKPCSNDELQLRVRNQLMRYRQEKALRVAHHELDQSHRRISMQRAYIQQDLGDAKRFQRSLLPEMRMPLGLSAFAELQPAEQVGGDFYHVLLLGPNRARILIADITDHGVKAAVRASAVWAEYTSLDHTSMDPAEVLEVLNRVATEKYDDLCGCFLCLDVETSATGEVCIRYAQAGEAPITKVSITGFEDAPPPEDFMLGMIGGADFQVRNYTLRPGERLFLYTDGLYGQRNSQGQSFRDHLYAQVWQAAAKCTSIEQSVQLILDSFHHFRGSYDQADDIAILGLEGNPADWQRNGKDIPTG